MNREQATDDAIRLALTVPASAERAYAVFAEEFASWYPGEYTWSQDVLDTIGIEGREGGRCFERGPEGFWIDWGRVLAWEPPHRLVFSWQISPGASRCLTRPRPVRSSSASMKRSRRVPGSSSSIAGSLVTARVPRATDRR